MTTMGAVRTPVCAVLVLLLAVARAPVSAVGSCNNDLLKKIMDHNLKDCPSHVLDQISSKGPAIQFRVMSKTIAETFPCATGVLEKPVNNVAVIHNKFSFANKSLGSAYTNYTMIEGPCGFVYKYILEENYTGFKIVYFYVDGISFGYYGCTDEKTPYSNANETYTVCFAPLVDSEEVEASLLKCKAHLEEITGDDDLVLLPPCDNDNPYLAMVSARPE